MPAKTIYKLRLNPFRHLSREDRRILIALYNKTEGKQFTLKEVKGIVPSSQYLRSLKDKGKIRKIKMDSKKDGAVIWQIPEGLYHDIKTVLKQEEKGAEQAP